MKKQLLSLLFSACVISFGTAQSNNNSNAKKINGAQPFNKAEQIKFSGEEKVNSNVPPSGNGTGMSAANSVEIGLTAYDLQTNSAVGRRIVNHGDGTFTAVWTTAADPNPFNTRGSGYNYFNGTSWVHGLVQDRVEDVRTGWANVVLLGAGHEIVISHVGGGDRGLMQGTNSIKGDNVFSSFSQSDAGPFRLPSVGPPAKGPIWARIGAGGSDGNSIHVISNYFGGDVDSSIKVSGVKAPFIYSRSTDGGTTWDIQGITLPGYDSTRYIYGGGDTYAIDVKGNVVAVVNGGLGDDLTLWKSIDNGATFQRIFIDSFPYAPDYGTLAPLDEIIPTNDGSMEVIIDDNDKVHVTYSFSRVANTSANGAVFYPYTANLMYWNEYTNDISEIPVLGINDTLNILRYELLFNDMDMDASGYFEIGSQTTTFTGGCRYGSNSVLNKPSIGMDSDGNIYVIFSLPLDADSTFSGKSYRDIYGVMSTDNGVSWSNPVNLTQTPATEEAFGSLAKLVDSHLHIIYQEDPEPGTELSNGHSNQTNFIKYLKVDKSIFLGMRNEMVKNDLPVQLYPNPNSGSFLVDLRQLKSNNTSVSVFNVIGEMVYQNTNNFNNLLQIDLSNQPSGIYMIEVKTEQGIVTKKVTVSK